MADFEATGRDNGDLWFIKLAQDFEAVRFGRTSVSVDYFRSKDLTANGRKGTSCSLAAAQRVDSVSTELYALFRKLYADIPATSTEKITLGGVGARVKF